MKDRLPVRLSLLAVLILAAALRFTGLGFGLRHHPHWDERAFVEAVEQMRLTGDLDHRFYEYPGLFIYVLHAALACLPQDALHSPAAYLVARGVVAGFGVLSVALVFLLGRRLSGAGTGLVAALLLAVSPVDVGSAHTVRPDVALQAFVLLSLLAFTFLGERARGDLWAGLAMGGAAAVKFTGVLLGPSYLLARLLAPGRSVKRLALAVSIALLVLAAATPYAFIHGREFLAGVSVQWAAHYSGSGLPSRSYLENAGYYLGIGAHTLGPLGSVLFLVGLGLLRREWRAWAPLLTHLLVTLAVFCTADRAYDRFLVPASGTLALVVGHAVARAVRWGPWPVAALALLTACFPFASSFAYSREAARPGTRDFLADWVSARLPPGSRLLSTVDNLKLDTSRFELIPVRPLRAENRRQILEVDYVLWTEEDDPAPLDGLDLVQTFESHGILSLTLRVSRLPETLKIRYAQVPLERCLLRASENPTLLDQLHDGRRDTAWSTAGPQRPGNFLEVLLPEALTLGRIELDPGVRPTGAGRRFELAVSEDGLSWRAAAFLQGRAEVWEQPGLGPATQVLLLNPPVLAQGLRIVQAGAGVRRWTVAELRLDAEAATANR